MKNLSLIALFILFSIAFSQNTTLEYVMLYIRHGNRSPVQLYPTNPNNESYWARYGGLGYMTSKGIKQIYQLGEYVKEYYKEFVPASYDRHKVFFRSTGLERALETAYAFTAGMYKPNQAQQFSNATGLSSWFPIPVQSMFINKDPLFRFNSTCPNFEKLRTKKFNSKEYLDLNEKHKELISTLAYLSGIQDLDYYKIWVISDCYFNELNEGLTSPKWVTDNLNEIIKAKDYTYNFDFGSADMGRFYGGTLLNEVLTNLDNKITGNSNYIFAAYSNHDHYMNAFTSLLNITWPLREIPYASAIAIELRKDSNENHFIRILFRNHSYNNPKPFETVRLNGCTDLCPYNEFLRLVAHKAVSNYKKECGIVENMPHERPRPAWLEILLRAINSVFDFKSLIKEKQI